LNSLSNLKQGVNRHSKTW